MIADLRSILSGSRIQARCLECGGMGPTTAGLGDAKLLDLLLARIGF